MGMSLKAKLAAGVALLACVALSACVGPSAYDLNYEDNGKTVKMATGDTLTITLDGNPTTGYLWVFGAPFDQEMLVMTSESYTKPEGSDRRVGVPVKKVMTFKAFNPGRTGIQLEYKRPWERNEKPLRTFDIMIQITGEPLEGKPDSDETPRVGSSGKPKKDPAEELFGTSTETGK